MIRKGALPLGKNEAGNKIPTNAFPFRVKIWDTLPHRDTAAPFELS